MAIPIGIPLVGGANVWMALGPALAMSVAGGWLLAAIERHLQSKATVQVMVPTEEKALQKAA